MRKMDVTEQDAVVACDVCLKEIPRSVARSFEGSDYVHHFCGQGCYDQWLAGQGMRAVGLVVSGVELDFAAAQALAQTMATRHAKDAMLLAWFDREQGKESPQVPECQHKPGWLAYAESHGGNLKIDINHGAYVFIFACGQQ
ncbi:MAG TPA: AF1514 family protein [Acidiferrobacterales bacterium]|nr:AF1514 family protein [Acidiferrobacterales bacterium]